VINVLIWAYVALIATAIVAVLGWLVQSQTPPWARALAVAVLVVAILSQGVILWTQHKAQQKQRYYGVLSRAKSTVLSAVQEAYPRIRLGDSDTFLVWKGVQGEPIIKFFEDAHLTIWIEDGGLKVSTLVRGKAGHLVAEIVANEWRVQRPPGVFDRNYDREALEVRGPDGDVILQVVLEEDYIRFAAKMYDSSGRGIAVGAGQDPQFGKVGVIEVTGPEHPDLELVIPPLFKYPSDLHFGERVR